jgi:alpha-mannosidase
VQANGPVRISIGENGPLVGSLVIESSAPGCNLLRRELRLYANEDCLHLINFVDKQRLAAKSYSAKDGKESLNFDFPFNIPDGDISYDTQFGTAEAERDQLPGSCKNWLTVNRWAAVASGKLGVNLVALDAPLMEAGYLSATLLNSQTNPDIWRKHINRTQRLYSWAMNNHWGTNYRAYQEGATTFEYIIQPFAGRQNPAATTRFAMASAQPLLVSSDASEIRPVFTLNNDDILVTGLKPSEDGKATIIRLFNASPKSASARLKFGRRTLHALFFSDTGEHAKDKADTRLTLPGNSLTTLRAEF